MVTITNGYKTFRVTNGAVPVYKSMGFHTVTNEELDRAKHIEQGYGTGEVENFVEEGSTTLEQTVDEDTVFIEELLEKPLSQWSNEEVKDFVKIKGIDTSGAQKVSQVRGIIKTYLEEQNKNV